MLRIERKASRPYLKKDLMETVGSWGWDQAVFCWLRIQLSSAATLFAGSRRENTCS